MRASSARPAQLSAISRICSVCPFVNAPVHPSTHARTHARDLQEDETAKQVQVGHAFSVPRNLGKVPADMRVRAGHGQVQGRAAERCERYLLFKICIVLFLVVLVHMRLHLHTSLLLLTILCPMLLLNSHYFGAVFRFFFKRSCLGLTFGCCTQPCTCKIKQVARTKISETKLVQQELQKESARTPLAFRSPGMSTWQRTVAPAAEVNVYTSDYRPQLYGL